MKKNNHIYVLCVCIMLFLEFYRNFNCRIRYENKYFSKETK